MERKLNIGIFVDSFYPKIDGVAKVVNAYAKRLANVANVYVFTLSPKKPYDDNEFPYKVIRCKSIKLKNAEYPIPIPFFDKKFIKEIEKANLDIVHAHSPFFIARMGIKYAKKHNLPAVITAHSQYKINIQDITRNNFFTSIAMHYTMKTFNSCDEVFACNKGVKEVYVNDYKLKAPCLVFDNATSMLPDIDDSIVENLRNKYNIKDEKVFLFVGRIVHQKKVFFIADVLKILKENNFKYKMIYVGDGPDIDKLKKYVLELGISENVEIIGQISKSNDIKGYYKMADLFIFPSIYDCSSIVQIEAACFKTPSIFTKDAVTASTIEPDRNGYVAIHDPNAFANKIIEIFADMNKYNNVCTNAYNEVYITWDKVVDNAFMHYQELINKKRLERQGKK